MIPWVYVGSQYNFIKYKLENFCLRKLSAPQHMPICVAGYLTPGTILSYWSYHTPPDIQNIQCLPGRLLPLQSWSLRGKDPKGAPVIGLLQEQYCTLVLQEGNDEPLS